MKISRYVEYVLLLILKFQVHLGDAPCLCQANLFLFLALQLTNGQEYCYKVTSWYDVDGEIAAAGDIAIVFGLSPGIMREISVLKYHYKYLGKKTKVIWFRNTLREEIPKEISEEIPIIYINSVEELSSLL